MKNKSIIPNIIGMIIISILLIFGASRCSGPVPQATVPDTAKDSAAEQTVPETDSGETGTDAEEAESDGEETTEGEAAEPAEDETASAGEEAVPEELSFLDVPDYEWFRDSVAYVFGKGLMNGVTEDTFAPDSPVSRGMLVTILHRMAGSPDAAETIAFSDVTPGMYYEAPIAWAAGNGIVNGYPDGTFGPENSVTREQMATILSRFAQNQGVDTSPTADLSGFSDRDQVNRMAGAFLSDFGHIDALVCSAGIARQELFTDVTPASWREILGVDLDGVFHCCQAVLPDMLRRKAGRIVTLSSMWGQVGGSCEVAYSAAKAGVIGLTKALAKELGPSGITVNCVAPGVIDTEMNRNLSLEDKAALAEETPLERIGTPRDVAETIWFLVSPAGDFLTGQVLAPNGGFVI